MRLAGLFLFCEMNNSKHYLIDWEMCEFTRRYVKILRWFVTFVTFKNLAVDIFVDSVKVCGQVDHFFFNY